MSRFSQLPEIERRLAQKPVGFVRGFRDFFSQYGVLPLAVGVVIGSAVNDLVKSLVENLITPLIALVTPEGKLQNLQVTFHGSTFHIGLAINALLSFIVVAWVVYLAAKFVLRNEDLLKKN